MNSKKLNFRAFAGMFIITASLLACNNSSSDDKIADTAATPAYTSPDTAQSNVPSDMPADSSSTMSSMDTSSAQSTKTTTAATTSTKKKGRAKAEIEPVAKNSKITMDKAGVYNYAEVAPSFPGGQNAIDNYINNNIDYPQTALDDNKEGRVGITFVVNEDGTVSDAHSIGSKVGYGLDEEAARVVSKMPKWNPGKVKGKAVKTKITLPIVFQIEE